MEAYYFLYTAVFAVSSVLNKFIYFYFAAWFLSDVKLKGGYDEFFKFAHPNA